MTRSEKIASNKLDKEINQLYREVGNGVQLHMMDISKVFDAARLAHKENRDMRQAMINVLQEVRTN